MLDCELRLLSFSFAYGNWHLELTTEVSADQCMGFDKVTVKTHVRNLAVS